VVTSDNPRTEEPSAIVAQILEGVRAGAPREAPVVDVDRRRAIAAAVASARAGQDVVLIAGKGHEDYQIIGKEKIHFSDQEQILVWAESKAPLFGAKGAGADSAGPIDSNSQGAGHGA
jgi:UDP-N-acetylmuramoyl-L-alanyl-D-glutamate--2,6-diaminopimelate ligase